MTIIAKISLAALVTLGTVSPAFSEEPLTRIVKTSDLNLSTADGIGRLDRRVSAAVREVCAAGIQSTPFVGVAEKECRDFARHNAFAQVAAIARNHQPVQVANR